MPFRFTVVTQTKGKYGPESKTITKDTIEEATRFWDFYKGKGKEVSNIVEIKSPLSIRHFDEISYPKSVAEDRNESGHAFVELPSTYGSIRANKSGLQTGGGIAFISGEEILDSDVHKIRRAKIRAVESQARMYQGADLMAGSKKDGVKETVGHSGFQGGGGASPANTECLDARVAVACALAGTGDLMTNAAIIREVRTCEDAERLFDSFPTDGDDIGTAAAEISPPPLPPRMCQISQSCSSDSKRLVWAEKAKLSPEEEFIDKLMQLNRGRPDGGKVTQSKFAKTGNGTFELYKHLVSKRDDDANADIAHRDALGTVSHTIASLGKPGHLSEDRFGIVLANPDRWRKVPSRVEGNFGRYRDGSGEEFSVKLRKMSHGSGGGNWELLLDQ